MSTGSQAGAAYGGLPGGETPFPRLALRANRILSAAAPWLWSVLPDNKTRRRRRDLVVRMSIRCRDTTRNGSVLGEADEIANMIPDSTERLVLKPRADLGPMEAQQQTPKSKSGRSHFDRSTLGRSC